MSLASDNMAYTAIDAVLQVFRRRLTGPQGIIFASILPAIPRAIFVKDWDIAQIPLAFSEREALTHEVQQIRVHHNLTPDNAIEATAWALRRHINAREFETAIGQLPSEARHFWHVAVADPGELDQKIFLTTSG